MEQIDSRLAGSQLSGALTNLSTSLSLVTVAPGLNAGRYRFRIDAEQLSGVYSGSGTSFTSLSRGLAGTTAASHRDGVQVHHVLGDNVTNLLTVEELDGNPSLEGVRKILLPNGTLGVSGTTATYTPTGGGGGGGAATSETVTVYNGTGSTLTKGTAVWNGGDADATSADIKVTVADKTAGGSANPILGLVSADITNGATGTVITFGSLTGLDTSTFAVGDYVMVGTTSPAIGLNLVPYISYDPAIYRHLVAIVTKSDATTGSIFIDPIEFSAEAHTHTDVGEGGKLGAPIFHEQTAPSSPSAGDQALYIDSADHHVKRKNSGGAVTELSESGHSHAESDVTSLGSDLALKAPIASPTFTGITTAPEFSASGLTGATAASRYVGATASGAPVSGTFVLGDWVIDQTGIRWTCTVGGSPGTWAQEPGTGGGGGGMTLISAQTVSGSTTSNIDFASIPNTYSHLVLELLGRLDSATTDDFVDLQLNGDSGSNYTWAYDISGGGGETGGGAAAGTACHVADIAAATAPANTASRFTLRFPFYADTTFHKSVWSHGTLRFGTGATNTQVQGYSGFWLSTAAINEIKLIAASGHFVAGSQANLYGIV